jgi:branched-chain amino acid transport system permease protein
MEATTYLGGVASIAGALVAGAVADGGLLTAAVGSNSSAATYAINGLMLMVVAVVYPDGVIAGLRALASNLQRRMSRHR